METRPMHWNLAATGVILAIAMGGIQQRYMAADTDGESSRTCPHYIALGSEHEIEIVDISFTDDVEGPLFSRRLPAEYRDQYRFAIVTLKITKPAGSSLSLAAADLTLHYYHGSEIDVSPCDGLSWFRTRPESDAPIHMGLIPGPGFIKQETEPSQTRQSVVYIDAVFTHMEADTRECWVCVGQPTTTRPFICPSPAWTNQAESLDTIESWDTVRGIQVSTR